MINYEDFKITPQMLAIISEIDEFKGSWKALGKIAPERLRALKKIATIESVGSSNRIEGNKLTDKQVEGLLDNLYQTSFKNRDEEEVAGYAKLMDLIFDDYTLIPFSENYIKQLHKILLEHSAKDADHKGEYKKISNTVAAFDEAVREIGVVFATASPFETPGKMEKLLDWTRKTLEDKLLHPLMTIGIFVVEFLAVHPFRDGNGRLSRALTALLLLKNGYAYITYSSIEAVIEDNKNAYYRSLRATQMTLKSENPNYEPWLMFFLKTLQKQKIRLEYKIGKENYAKLSLSQLSAEIIELFDNNDRITARFAAEKIGANINTVKKHLAALTKQGLIFKNGTTRGTWYGLEN